MEGRDRERVGWYGGVERIWLWMDGREWGPLICCGRFVSKVEWLIGGDWMNECVTVASILFKKIIGALSCHVPSLPVIDSYVTGYYQFI